MNSETKRDLNSNQVVEKRTRNQCKFVRRQYLSRFTWPPCWTSLVLPPWKTSFSLHSPRYWTAAKTKLNPSMWCPWSCLHLCDFICGSGAGFRTWSDERWENGGRWMGVAEEWESRGRQGDVPSGMREPGPERDSEKRDQMRPPTPEVRRFSLFSWAFLADFFFTGGRGWFRYDENTDSIVVRCELTLIRLQCSDCSIRCDFAYTSHFSGTP